MQLKVRGIYELCVYGLQCEMDVSRHMSSGDQNKLSPGVYENKPEIGRNKTWLIQNNVGQRLSIYN